MAKAAAIHISGDRFAAIVIDGTSKRWRVVSAEVGEIKRAEEGEDPIAPTSVAASTALKKVRAPREPLTLAVASSEAVFRNLQLPFTGDDAIEKVLKFESEGHFHQLNIDDVVIEHITIGEHKVATDMIVAAAPKKLLKQQIEALDRGGFDPMYVDLDALTLYNAALATGIVSQIDSALIVHVGHTDTLVLLIEEQRLRAVRSMRSGLASFELAVAKDLGIAEGDAAGKVAEVNNSEKAADLVAPYQDPSPRGELEKSPAELEASLVADRRDEFVKRLQREALRTATAEARNGPKEVLVCGEGAATPGLVEALGEALQVPSREVDFFAEVAGAPADPDVRRKSAIALGAALKGLGVDATKTNFRQEELRFSKKLESLKIPMAAIAATIAFTLLLENIYMFREIDSKKQQIVSEVQVAEAVIAGRPSLKKDVIKKYEKDPPSKKIKLYNSWAETELRNLKNLYGAGGSSFTKPQSAFEAVQRIFSVMKRYQDDMGAYVVDRLSAQTDLRNSNSQGVDIKFTITFLGEAISCADRCAEFRKRLKSNKWCIDTTEGSSTPVPDGVGTTWESLIIKVDLTKDQSDAPSNEKKQ
ncbi:MAG: hypothetical protein HY286_11805 [Planctomycetes bacterium]|nr:hypothetical protein [Planctomycetota bacterium]